MVRRKSSGPEVDTIRPGKRVGSIPARAKGGPPSTKRNPQGAVTVPPPEPQRYLDEAQRETRSELPLGSNPVDAPVDSSLSIDDGQRQTMPSDIRDVVGELTLKLARKDWPGVVRVAAMLRPDTPGGDEARQLLEQNATDIEREALRLLGGGEAVLRVTMPLSRVHALSLDHRAGFLFSLVDGTLTVSEIFDVSGMRAFDASLVLLQLCELGALRTSDTR